MIAGNVERRQPNMVQRWIRRVLRVRALLLALVVLPQLLGLGAMACIFCLLHVQETLLVPAFVNTRSAEPTLYCRVGYEPAVKVPSGVRVQVALLNPDNTVRASGEGRAQSSSGGEERAVLSVQGPGLADVVRRASDMASPRVRLRMRTRSVLDVVMEKGGR